MSDPDIIDLLAGLAPDSPLAMVRDRKPVTRQNAQASYRALFEPADPGDVTAQERFAVASFIADLHAPDTGLHPQDTGLHGQDKTTSFYAAGLSRTRPAEAFVAAISAEIIRGRSVGPYGAYPEGPLSAEDVAGPTYHVDEGHRPVLGAKLTAALEHVHLLVFHPRDANAAGLQRLLDAGWSNAGIVTLSQLTAFLAFQIRVVAGLRTLAAAGA
jgi:CMD domain protein